MLAKLFSCLAIPRQRRSLALADLQPAAPPIPQCRLGHRARLPQAAPFCFKMAGLRNRACIPPEKRIVANGGAG